MSGKTHIAVGTAAAMLLLRPANLQELILGTGAAAIGSVISDIDAGTSTSRREARQIECLVVVAVVTVVFLNYLFQADLYGEIMRYSTTNRVIFSVISFVLICAVGMKTTHRTFMHSFLALLLLDACAGVFLPSIAAYFTVGFLSHLALDFVNRKKLQLFFPWQRRLSLGLCSAEGLVDHLLLLFFSLYSTGHFAILAMEYYR